MFNDSIISKWENCGCPICNVMVKIFEPKYKKKYKYNKIKKN